MVVDFDRLEQQIKQRGRIETLPNGIVLITENTPETGLTQGQISIHAGSAYEAKEDHGIMHFLEHMCIGESRNYPNREQRNLESAVLGLNTNAFTGPFSVVFPIQSYFREPHYLLQSNFVKAFQIVTDLAYFPRITEESFQRERLVVQREREEKEHNQKNDPFKEIKEKIANKMQSQNPAYQKDGLGTKETIEAITPKKLREYHTRFFVGKNTIVTIIGDLNTNSGIKENILETLNEIPAGESASPIIILPEKPYQGRETLEFKKEKERNAEVNIYFQVPALNTTDNYLIHLTSNILGGDSNSLLFRNLRERKGLVYGVRCSYSGHDKTGLLSITYSVDNKDLEESLKTVDESLESIRKGDFNPLLVESFKSSFIPTTLSALQMPGWISAELMQRHYRERFGHESTAIERLRYGLGMTKKDVVDFANKYLGENRLITIVK